MRRLTSTITVTAAVLVFVVASVVGVRLLSAGTAAPDEDATCQQRTIAAGEKVTPNLVTVNLYNASERSGLANRVSINLQRRGFLAGQIGNAPYPVKSSSVTIVSDDRRDPRVELVAQQFADEITYAKPKTELPDGIAVVIGEDYEGLAKKSEALRVIEADQPINVCVPVGPLS